MKFNCRYIKIDDDELFKNRSKIPTFVLISLWTILNLEVDGISLQQLGYDIDHTDYLVNYNFFEIRYCCHPALPYTHIQL